MAILITLPYKDVEKNWNIWAMNEDQIDFRKNQFEAERCTICFAAFELKNFLIKTNESWQISVGERRSTDSGIYFIELKIEQKNNDGSFKITPIKNNGLVIIGYSRCGLIYGVYEFLRMQGWRWIEPGERGEFQPKLAELNWPQTEIEITPSFQYRGIGAYRESQDSREYVLWMARNRLNIYPKKAYTGKLADKLGMYSRTGGHLLQDILAPNRYLTNGKTIWEEHPEWYGLPENGERTKEKALKVQLCISQASLLKFIADELLEKLNNEFAAIDILDVWGLDTWGAICSCPECKKIGNGADHNLHLLSALRRHIDTAKLEGKFNREVLIDIIAYEGTVTLEPPTKPLPDNLKKSGDISIFYPIRRCYQHELSDETCEYNQKYRLAWIEWNRRAKELSLWLGEYYNVSYFEDLPLLFMNKIPDDMRFYHKFGASGATYMHGPFVNWGMRALTQIQHAQYAWDVNTNSEQLLRDYFASRYGEYATEMFKAYKLINSASADVASWRNSLVGVLDYWNSWNGEVPTKPLKFGHFKNSQEVMVEAGKAIINYEDAKEIIEDLIKKEQTENWKNLPSVHYAPITPLDLLQMKKFDNIEYRLGENLRLLRYGIDTMRLLAYFFRYYNALFHNEWTEATECWNQIEAVATEMNGYYQPISYEQPGAGLRSLDALTRTQLRRLLTRCRGVRIRKEILNKNR